jgi:hypothetical protein
MTIMNLIALAALLPGVILLILAICKKAEETRQLNKLNARMRQRAQADSDSAWLRNKQMWME